MIIEDDDELYNKINESPKLNIVINPFLDNNLDESSSDENPKLDLRSTEQIEDEGKNACTMTSTMSRRRCFSKRIKNLKTK